VRQDGFSKASVGDTVALAWSTDDEHRFEAKSGQRRNAAPNPARQAAMV